MEPDFNGVEPSQLNESQLRELYERAEIDRFFRIFSTYITEVKTSDVQSASDEPITFNSGPSAKDSQQQSISAHIAANYVSPNLPLQHRETAPFSLARVRLTVNRLSIVAQLYWPYCKTIIELAQWTKFETSLAICIGYWILWWFNVLLPSLIFLLLVGFLRRGLLPYPSLKDLQEHQRRILQADEFSDRVSSRISPSSTLDLKELWRLYRLTRSDRKPPLPPRPAPAGVSEVAKPADGFRPPLPPRPPPAEILRAEVSPNNSATNNRTSSQDEQLAVDDATIFDDPQQSKDAMELRRELLQVFIEVANFNERLRSIATWRNPSISRRYLIALCFIFVATLVIPIQYLTRGLWFGVGFAFWHVTPVACALSPEDLQRIPPPFSEVPTDAEHAMELISERVAKGQDIHALQRAAKQRQPLRASTEDTDFKPSSDGKPKSFGKFVGDESLRAAKGAMKLPAVASRPLLSGALSLIQAPEPSSDVHTFMGQRGSASPGIITLTAENLIFSPLIPSQPKVKIDVKVITSVKKIGLLKGLAVIYLDPETNAETEERFLWISKRDYLFARLVVLGQKKWKNV